MPLNRRLIISCIISIFVLILLLFGYLWCYNFILFNIVYKTSEQISRENDLIEKFYKIYQPLGKENITDIVKNVNNLSGAEKLNEIANLTLYGFESYHWGNNCSGKSYYFDGIPISFPDRYCISTNGNYRALEGSTFYGNPYWIAYHRVGACYELAVLFHEVATQANFSSRVVCAPWHCWVEIKNENSWWYFDPLCYKRQYLQNKKYSIYWYNQTKYYRIFCDFTPIYIKVENSTELRDFDYLPMSGLKELFVRKYLD